MEHELFDQVHIHDLFLRCILGINPEERVKKQDVLINITLFADLRHACRTDRIEDAVNYKEIKTRLVESVEASSFFLVERLAGHIADLCLQHPRVQGVRVLVEKPGALRFARSVGIEITRMKGM